MVVFLGRPKTGNQLSTQGLALAELGQTPARALLL
jgi:hypothetical protein